MILQSLTSYYEEMRAQGRMPEPGWGKVKISYELHLEKEGGGFRLIPMKTLQQRGKKMVELPMELVLPAPVQKTINVESNFLWENASYLLGVDEKGKLGRTAKCYEACRQLHLGLLGGIAHPAARAVCCYFTHWQPELAFQHPDVKAYWEELKAGVNLLFVYEGSPLCEVEEIREAWGKRYQLPGDGPALPCLVTGQVSPAALTHPVIKGVRDAQPSGAALVSFNAPAFCSNGREQSANAPVSKYAAFAYTTALNQLLADRKRVSLVGDSTIVCWAQGGDCAYVDLAMAALYGDRDDLSPQAVQAALEELARGGCVSWQGRTLEPDTQFYVLGLSPNVSRLSVRFFLRDRFGSFAAHLQEHQRRLEIIRPVFDLYETLPLWKLLAETVNPNAKDKRAHPQMAGDVLRAILTGGPYPATLLNAVMLRVRADKKVTRGRAAILKAYYLRNEQNDFPKEVLTVELNEHSTYLPYILGRLFSILEAVQENANPGLGATIKDKYFNAAAATPETIFPLLLHLSQKHLRKLEGGKRRYWDGQIAKLVQHLSQVYPSRLTLPEQGAFQLGYYHQTQKRYQRKEEVLS